MDDGHLVQRVAAEYVARLGKGALPNLLEKELLARLSGDDLSADAWLDIAEAAAALLQCRRG